MRWIIGDIHGMLRPLQTVLAEVNRRDPWAHLLFVGDYVNRGPDSNGVIELLLTLKNAHFIRGNHDDIFDMILHGSCYVTHPAAPDPLSAFCWFMEHGLADTFISYGIDYAELVAGALADDQRAIVVDNIPWPAQAGHVLGDYGRRLVRLGVEAHA